VLLPVGIAAETDQQLTVVLADDSHVTAHKSNLLLPLDLPQVPDDREQTREARDEQLRAAAAKVGHSVRGTTTTTTLFDAEMSSGGSDKEGESSAVASMQAQIAAADVATATAGRVPEKRTTQTASSDGGAQESC
jgi:hypothetical protein